MKKNLLALTIMFLATLGLNAQSYPMDAPDFTVTDIEGIEHNLYEYLDAGKVVVVDVSATWCGPCWSFHSTHVLEDLYQEYGPEGTDEVVVIWYEGDAATTQADLEGNTGGSIGNWLEGASYTFINESPIQLNLQTIWAPLGFPTVNVIDPTTKQIVFDAWQTTSLSAFEGVINDFTTLGDGLDANGDPIGEGIDSGINDDLAGTVNVFPNPTEGQITVSLDGFDAQELNVTVSNALGQTVLENLTAQNQSTLSLDVSDFSAGFYSVNVSNGTQKISKRFLKK